MYKLIDEKEKIKAFRLFNSDAYFIQGDGKNLTKLSFNQREVQIEMIHIPKQANYHRVYFLQESIIFVDSSNKGWLLDKSDEMNELPFKYYFYNENTKKGIASEVFSYTPISYKSETFDLTQNKVLWEKWNSPIQMPLPDIFFETLTKNDLIFLDKDTGTPLWHFSLTTLNDLYPEFQTVWEVWNFVGVVDGVLWVCLDNKKANGALLGLDVYTGKFRYFLHRAQDQTQGARPTMPFNANTQYDPHTNKLIGFGNYHYWEVDLNQTPYQPKIWNLEKELRAFNTYMAPGQFTAMNETHIFSASGYLGNTTSQVFALNRQTFQIDWNYVFDMEERGYYTPVKEELTETHLFVLDSTGTLHIFEREG